MPSSTYESLVEGEHPQPLDRSSLVAWERRWEDYLEKMYTVPSRETTRFATDDLRYNIYALLTVLSSGAEIQRLAGEAKTRELGWMQQKISRASLPLAELTWRALPLAKREEVVLLAIDQALQLEPGGFKLRRMMTPEVTMKKLAAADKDGGTFLALLRPIIARRSGATIQKPVFTPNTVFDTICLVACVGDTTTMRFVNIHRAIALSHIVWNILCVTVCSSVHHNSERTLTLLNRELSKEARSLAGIIEVPRYGTCLHRHEMPLGSTILFEWTKIF